jgi:hypothetical protein
LFVDKEMLRKATNVSINIHIVNQVFQQTMIAINLMHFTRGKAIFVEQTLIRTILSGK